MKLLTFLLVILLPLSAYSNSDKDKKELKGHLESFSIFDVIPLNSPVKESVAKFLIKIPPKFEIDEILYQVKNSGRIFERPKDYQKINLIDGIQGKELRINVSKLPPGFYQLLVKIKDRSKKEHHFKTKFKDHAMFVIDSSLQVPVPDPKKNDATVAGIDSDNDGIRDDIQRWINEEFNSQPKIKMALRQNAIGRQEDLLNIISKEKSIISSRKVLDNNHCIYSIINPEDGYKLIKDLDSKLLNTKDRLEADIKANANFSGQAYELPKTIEEGKARCSFNPDDF